MNFEHLALGKSVSGTMHLQLAGLGGEGRGSRREKKLLHVFRTAGFTLQRYYMQIFKYLGVLVLVACSISVYKIKPL